MNNTTAGAADLATCRAEMDAAVNSDDWLEIWGNLCVKAKQGDIPAIRLLLAYHWGTPEKMKRERADSGRIKIVEVAVDPQGRQVGRHRVFPAGGAHESE